VQQTPTLMALSGLREYILLVSVFYNKIKVLGETTTIHLQGFACFLEIFIIFEVLYISEKYI
jgi:hypothetical protein